MATINPEAPKRRIVNFPDSVDTGRTYPERIQLGEISGSKLVHKFGGSEISSTLLPVTLDGTYQTPTTAQALEILSDDANDTFLGTGARTVTVLGLDANWDEISQTIEMNGTTAVPIPTSMTRVCSLWVSSSGTYATASSGSHLGTLTVQGSGGGSIWGSITNSPFPTGQSQIGVYSIPRNKKGLLWQKLLFTNSTKTVDLYFFKRENIDDVSVPYSGTMRLFEREVGLSGGLIVNFDHPQGPFIGPCDIGFMGKVTSGTAECSVEFILEIIDV